MVQCPLATKCQVQGLEVHEDISTFSFSFPNKTPPQKLLLSPLQPTPSPKPPNNPQTQSIPALTNPLFLLPLPSPPPKPPAPIPTPPTAFGSPVAYSLPILGSTFSPALRDTKSVNGTSQMQMPK